MTTPADLGGTLSGDQRNAFEAVNNLFSSYGLESLAPKIYGYIQNGYSADTTSILLQNSDEYKQRFQGNEMRKKAGLPVLSPSQYLATEQQYRQLMQQSGMPKGFYDQPSDFNDFIGKDVSPTELKGRIDLASQASILANPSYKQALNQMYGIDEKGISAFFLDEDRALPALQKQAAAAQIGAEALAHGLNISTKAEEYAKAGVTQAQAAKAYGQIAQQLPEYSQFAHLYGQEVTQQNLEESLFGPTGAPTAPGQQTQEARIAQLESMNRARAEGKVGGAGPLMGLARTSTET